MSSQCTSSTADLSVSLSLIASSLILKCGTGPEVSEALLEFSGCSPVSKVAPEEDWQLLNSLLQEEGRQEGGGRSTENTQT